MRAFTRHDQRGFTLVELMLVVSLIGILAALAIFGVNRYLKSAKSGEARNGIGRISHAAEESYARETVAAELVALGSTSATVVHQLCDSAFPVPGSVPVSRKYQPNNIEGVDFLRGTATAGWKCLRFEINDAIYYQYNYLRNSTTLCATYGCVPANQSPNFETAAIGDLDGDGVHSAFILNGQIDATTSQFTRATFVYVENEYE